MSYFEIKVDLEARTAQDLQVTNLYILEEAFHLLNKECCPHEISQCDNLAPPNCEGLFMKQRPAGHEKEVQALTSHLVLLSHMMWRPVLHHVLFGHGFGCCEGFTSVLEDKCHL